ncbi:MAG: hypothetical protein MHM6MM_004609 [Cercozoa sp. M6MM]
MVLKSFVAYTAECEFPLENLPFGVFKRNGEGESHIGVAIGDQVLDMHACADEGLLAGLQNVSAEVFKSTTLNDFMAAGKAARVEVRALLQQLLAESSSLASNVEQQAKVLLPMGEAVMQLPARIGDYTDFYSSRFHATNVGIMFRGKDNALQPNWLHLPVGYHGRASSVVVSGTPVRRPCGQLRPDPEAPPTYGACRLLDFEMEMAFFVGGPENEMGTPININEARDRIFGFVLMNDWSARDIQKWEYVPLGPFNGKNFASSISPWVVTTEALEPFFAEPEPQVPEVLPYLKDPKLHAIDIDLQVDIVPEGCPTGHAVCKTNCKYLYWSFEQQLTHHASTGCPMRAGDLLGSGTISGPDVGSYGSMLEISWKGTKPVTLTDADGSERKMIKDGDTVIMSGIAQGDGFRVGFGTCEGKLLPALQQ